MKLTRTQSEPSDFPQTATISVTVELFGNARLLADRETVELCLPPQVTADEVADRLAEALPDLVGEVIKPDGGLMASYILNLNGASFMSDLRRPIRSGDRFLLFSSQAGG